MGDECRKSIFYPTIRFVANELSNAGHHSNRHNKRELRKRNIVFIGIHFFSMNKNNFIDKQFLGGLLFVPNEQICSSLEVVDFNEHVFFLVSSPFLNIISQVNKLNMDTEVGIEIMVKKIVHQ
jgi:hypothetical protein